MKAGNNTGSNNSLAAALFILIMTASVAAARPRPKDDAKANSATGSGALMAMASIPSLPKLSNTACPANSACEGTEDLARQMVELVDADRENPANNPETGGRAHPLKWDPRLAQAALQHSEDMAVHHYFSHVDPNGKDPVDRITPLGVQWRTLGENIAKNFSVPQAEEAFMNEPRFESNHRANILNPKFNYIGVGVFQGPDGMVYVTQDFAQEQ